MTTFNLVKREGDYYVEGLHDAWGDDGDMLLIVRYNEGDCDTVHDNNENMHRALYDLLQTSDCLHDGDDFAIDGTVVYRCEGVHVVAVDKPLKWGWDADLVAAIELLAETPMTTETPGSVLDEPFDWLITTARMIVQRETLRAGDHDV